MVSHHRVARDTTEIGLMRFVRTLAVVPPSLALVQALAYSRDYRQPALAPVVWLVVLGAGFWLVPRLRAGGLAAGETAAAIGIAVAAVAATGALHRSHGATAGVDLAILGTVWLLVLVAMSHSPWVWIPAALLVFAAQGTLLIRHGGLTPLSLSRLEVAGYIIVAVLTVFAAVRSALEMRASVTARRASLASRLAAERAAAAAVQQERRGRLAVLEQAALPLLRGIADGALDPAADDVAARCARHAAVLRHSLAEGTPGACDLVAALEPALRAAAARGLPVTVQVIGDTGTPRHPVTRATAAVVDVVLSALGPDQQVVLTMLAAGDDAELYLTFGGPLPALPDLARFGLDVPAAACWHAAAGTTETGGLVEVRWRKEGAA